MASVKLKPNESQEQLLRRFRKRVTNAGILSTVRRKRWHISKSELRRIEKKRLSVGHDVGSARCKPAKRYTISKFNRLPLSI